MTGILRHIAVICLGLAACLGTGPRSAVAQAQNAVEAPADSAPAILVADQIYITANRTLVAQGNVEAFQGEFRLRAHRVTYDQNSETLKIEGPIRIDQGGEVTILADSGELDRGLQNGLLTGARMVMDEQLQLNAVQMSRVSGRYTQLYKSAVTSCRVCDDGKPPLWQIRARKIIHDQEEKQIYFEDAQFRVMDVPIFYFPRLRLPDPTLDRANGFLVPSIRTTSELGTGFRVPYFFRIGDHADLTLAPYISSKTKTLDYRYRQAFRRGRMEFEGAFTRDDLYPGQLRWYLFGDGVFNMRNDYKIEFDIKTVSDNGYLVDYGLPDYDRLNSTIALTKTERDNNFWVGLTFIDSLRDSEVEAEIPTQVADVQYEKRFFPTGIGGELRAAVDVHGHYRTSAQDVVGRDVDRLTTDLSWRNNWILPHGLRADWRVAVAGDAFHIHQDSNYPDKVTRLTPYTAATLRYPMTRVSGNGVTQFLEPIAQVGWSDVGTGDIPNDESGFVEFDQGNLLAMSRFPAPDRREDGLAAVVGMNWSRYDEDGWKASATVGQVFRETANPDFTTTSGLSGTSSDYLVAGQLIWNDDLSLTARTLIDDSFGFSKAAVRGSWTGKRTSLTGTYMWLGADAAEARPVGVSEVWFDGSYEITPSWTASANARYDLSESRASTAGVGIVYRNECVEVDLSLNRRYTSSLSVEPQTNLGFTIALHGFSVAGEANDYRRTCNKS